MTLPSGGGDVAPGLWWLFPGATGDAADGGVSGLPARLLDDVKDIMSGQLISGGGLDGIQSLAEDLYSGLRQGISLPLAIAEAIINKLFGTNIQFTDMGTLIDAIEQIPGARTIIELIKQATGVDLDTVFDGLDLSNPGAVLVAIEQAVEQAIEGAVQKLIDTLFNAVSVGANATGVSLGLLGGEMGRLATNVETAIQNAAQSFDVTQQFGALLQQAVHDLESLPIYQGPLDFLTQIETAVGQLLSNVFQGLSPANPAVASTNAQINALWAAVSASSSMVGIRYLFDLNTPLVAKWTAPSGFSFPTVVTANNAGAVTSNGVTAMVYTDQRLASDRYEVSMVVEELAAGTTSFFMTGNYSGGVLGAHVSLDFNHQVYGQSLSIVSRTAPNTVGSAHASISTGASGPPTNIAGINVGDTLGLQYDGTVANGGTDTYTIFVNAQPVISWPASGLAHGAGTRDVGVVCNLNNYVYSPGPLLGQFVANDY